MYTYTETNIHICFRSCECTQPKHILYTINIVCPNTHTFTITSYDIKNICSISKIKTVQTVTDNKFFLLATE